MARLGSVNQHPAKLPRHRGPIPMAWALREGDGEFGVTWHRMDAELDTSRILAQTTVPIEDDDVTIEQIGPKLTKAMLGLLPRVFERLEAGDPGDPQTEEGATSAGHFGEDYASVDWSQPARKIHDQVRAWWLTFGMSEAKGPIAELDGERVKLVRTSLTDPGGGAQAVQCGEGKLWIVEVRALSSSFPPCKLQNTGGGDAISVCPCGSTEGANRCWIGQKTSPGRQPRGGHWPAESRGRRRQGERDHRGRRGGREGDRPERPSGSASRPRNRQRSRPQRSSRSSRAMQRRPRSKQTNTRATSARPPTGVRVAASPERGGGGPAPGGPRAEAKARVMLTAAKKSAEGDRARHRPAAPVAPKGSEDAGGAQAARAREPPRPRRTSSRTPSSSLPRWRARTSRWWTRSTSTATAEFRTFPLSASRSLQTESRDLRPIVIAFGTRKTWPLACPLRTWRFDV